MFEAKPVIGGFHARGQAAGQVAIVEVDMQVGQDGAPRLQALDPGQGPLHMGVGRVRPPAEGVDCLLYTSPSPRD